MAAALQAALARPARAPRRRSPADHAAAAHARAADTGARASARIPDATAIARLYRAARQALVPGECKSGF